jgi:hypothetical protein
MAKRSLIISYSKLSGDVIDLVKQKYPFGFDDDIKEYTNHKNEPFQAFAVETDDTNYLIRVQPGEEKRVDYYMKDVMESSAPTISYEYKGESEDEEVAS